MLVLGLILLVGGVVAAIIGNGMNNDLGLQLQSMVDGGKANPGDTLLYIGIAVAVIGVVLMIVHFVKKK